MRNQKFQITKRNKTYLVVSAIMILVGFPTESHFLTQVGIAIQIFIWVDMLADNLKMKSE